MNNQRSNQPKIAYILSTFPSLSETFILQEILELERQGLQLRIFSLGEPSAGDLVEAVRDVRAPITYFPHLSPRILMASVARCFFKAPLRFLHTTLALSIHYRQRSVLRHILYAAYLAHQLKHEGITHTHAHFATTPTLVAQATYLLTDIPYSFMAHAFDIYSSSKSLLAYKIHMATFVATCSIYTQKYLAKLVDQHLDKRIHCIYVGLDLDHLPSSTHVPLEPPLILSVARLIEKKGLVYLLRACRILKDQSYNFTCRIVGDGPLLTTLEREIRELDLTDRVQLWGAETNERVLEMYQQATIMTLPCIVSSNGDRDGLPRVLAEAMYMGVPVISTPISGIPELINSGINGLLVPPQDSQALASALACLLDDPLLRSRLAVAGKQTVVEQFDLVRNIGRLLNLLCTN